VEKQHYAVPLDAVLEITRTADSDIHEVDGREILQLRDQVLSVVRLNRLLAGSPSSFSRTPRHFVLTIGAGSRKFGLVVDGLIGEEELVIKSLRTNWSPPNW